MSKHKQAHNTHHRLLGASPGTLTYVGKAVSFATQIKLIEYNAAEVNISQIPASQHLRELSFDPQKMYWLNVDGIHEPEVVATVGEVFQLHPLLLEDVMNTHQKPKFEYFDTGKQLFFTFKMIEYNKQTQSLEIEHLNIILAQNCVISFQEERKRDIFEPIIARLMASAGKTRKNGADYLFYALIDLVVDHYFSILDCISEHIERLEEAIINAKEPQAMHQLYGIKREILQMKKVVFPLREMISVLLREEYPMLSDNTSLYMRDVQDHISQIIENIDSYRELVASLMDLHLSQVSNKMNNIMQFLTVISVIFMPLTFIAGIYGMNFDEMPELHWHYGYPLVWGIMLALVLGMAWLFKRKGWLQQR